ncbi:uncharacterized protein L203_104955 [Cryptococcus depauperatus CBS 7841]|uniref:2,5-diamino-6-ribosylamino-4(3H)-pyrimidinone 5'-phosphate reductase n=1 Tax=Cryptococcus depauperatus CBS 7841 TaxID=1295531 RepID=A0A1E3IMT9_9TREE|nr:2,5-diamino-6-(ribosylamino)-4(3H)-pyrimidinone 5'-phosphate reductase [Cryptococcus depauperatus CBS 7841]
MSSPKFLENLFSTTTTAGRPHITLTWAQSLDGKIAGVGEKRVILSGPESMVMTHWIRSMHDAILIGVQTLVLDDPRLQTNLLPVPRAPPQPLILDPTLRFPLNSKVLQEWNTKPDLRGKAVKQPWILCGSDVQQDKIKKVEDAGARVIPVPLDSNGHIPPSTFPRILTSLRLNSIMIEGGSRVLSTFLHSPTREDGSKLVDSVVVTVAPMFIGEGIGFIPLGHDKGLPPLKHIHIEKMGKDAVMVCSIEAET